MSCSGLLRFSSDLHEGSCDLFRLQELVTYNLPQNNNPTNYWSLLNYLFDPTDGKTGAGLNYIRVPLGASDFSATCELGPVHDV